MAHDGRSRVGQSRPAPARRRRTVARYPPIGDQGVIGNLHTVAPISTDGTVDWYRSPRFDSPSMFASLLDANRGGQFVLRPARGEAQNKQLYFPDTNVLITPHSRWSGRGAGFHAGR